MANGSGTYHLLLFHYPDLCVFTQPNNMLHSVGKVPCALPSALKSTMVVARHPVEYMTLSKDHHSVSL